MTDFLDDLLSICTQNLMAVEDDWNCEDEIDKLLASTHGPYLSNEAGKPWDHEIDELFSVCQNAQPESQQQVAKPVSAVDIEKAQESCVPANMKKLLSGV